MKFTARKEAINEKVYPISIMVGVWMEITIWIESLNFEHKAKSLVKNKNKTFKWININAESTHHIPKTTRKYNRGGRGEGGYKFSLKVYRRKSSIKTILKDKKFYRKGIFFEENVKEEEVVRIDGRGRGGTAEFHGLIIL